MKRIFRVALLSLFILGAEPVAANGFSAKNIVMNHNRADGLTLARSSTSVLTVFNQESLSPENLAYSRSWECSGCRTVSVAVQAVITTAGASSVSPRNAAVAVNASCSFCQTFAAAYQYVATVPTPSQLSPDARAEIRRISTEIEAVADSGLAFPEMDARLDALAAELWQVIDMDLGITGSRLESDEIQ